MFILCLLLIVILSLLSYCGYILLNEFKEYNEVFDTQNEIIGEIVSNTKESPYSDSDFSIDWNKLLSINSDVCAWIRVPDTNINFPVVHSSNNDKYLKRNIYGGYSRGGTVFVDANISNPFTCKNTVIYGHNLMNGTMFSQIKKYSNSEFYNAHNIIYIYLPNGEIREYKVLSLHIVNADSKNIYNPYVTDIEKYSEFVFQNNKISGINAEIYSNDNMITLSTCTNADDNERYVLHAVWVNKV